MKNYIGTKTVNATPMNRADYNILRGRMLPPEEDGEDEGYLVEYVDGVKANTIKYAGYISWSPKEQFDRAYRETLAEKSIGELIEAFTPTAPRITPTALQANIVSEHYFTGAEAVASKYLLSQAGVAEDDSAPASEFSFQQLELLTFCILVLRNGFTVTGESACVSPKNFDAGIGRKIARKNAEQKVWTLMGYALKEQLLQAPQPPVTSA